MVSPIEAMIDAACKCVKCGLGRKECRCYILLECPVCKRGQHVARDKDDPDRADRLVVPCPKHMTAEAEAEIDYYTAAGEVVPLD